MKAAIVGALLASVPVWSLKAAVLGVLVLVSGLLLYGLWLAFGRRGGL